LTGPWQVLDSSRIPFQEMVKMDYLYVANWSIWKLLLRTVRLIIRGDA
jgi:lipopolysaccharide/colanic/teichoic acid biosynthesis glycosyltransferase